MKRKRSLPFKLVFISSITAVSCSENMHRDVYRSREECLKDWQKEENCKIAPNQASGGQTSTYYHGPYYSSRSARPALTNTSLGRTTTTRGGFGSVGRFFSGRGG